MLVHGAMLVLGAIVDVGALLKVIAASIVAGVGVTVLFSIAIIGATRFADMRADGRPVEAAAFALLGLAGLAASIAAVVAGIIVMASK